MNIFRYALCFLFYGHDKEKVLQDDTANRLSLIVCTRCKQIRFERMWFERWWRLISDEERRQYLDVYRYNPRDFDDPYRWDTEDD
jgi:hypothetical protein